MAIGQGEGKLKNVSVRSAGAVPEFVVHRSFVLSLASRTQHACSNGSPPRDELFIDIA